MDDDVAISGNISQGDKTLSFNIPIKKGWNWVYTNNGNRSTTITETLKWKMIEREVIGGQVIKMQTAPIGAVCIFCAWMGQYF